MNRLLYLPLFFLVGPMTGALLRNWQSCCLDFSLWLALWFSPFLLGAYAVRFIPWFEQHRMLRSIVWWVGVAGWCFGAPISCGHALS
jgi:hypothetical protein